jgi:hypothetical protein
VLGVGKIDCCIWFCGCCGNDRLWLCVVYVELVGIHIEVGMLNW